MPDLSALLTEAAMLGGDVIGPRGYAVAYGSQTAGIGSPTSDLDLLYVLSGDITREAKQRLAMAVVDLHRRNGLRSDNEVAHEVKLTAATHEVAAAVMLTPFTGPDRVTIQIPAVKPTAAYLNSPEFKLRLVLGAMTGSHLFLCGNLTTYRSDHDASTRAVAVLVSAALADRSTFTYNEVREALLVHPTGATGKDHLGYLPGPALEHLTRTVVAELLALRVIGRCGRSHFEHRHPATDNSLLRPAITATV
jgi:hypothetical protein